MLHRIGKTQHGPFISLKIKGHFYVFALVHGRCSFFYNGYLPYKPWTYRFRFGPFEFERTNP